MADDSDLTRNLAQYLCDRMTAVIDGVLFVPEHGKDDKTPVGDAPFAVPLIIDAVRVNPAAGVHMVTVHWTLQTLPDDSTPSFHSDVVRQMLEVLKTIRSEGKIMAESSSLCILGPRGLYVAGTRPVPSTNAHVSMIDVRVACAALTAGS